MPGSEKQPLQKQLLRRCGETRPSSRSAGESAVSAEMPGERGRGPLPSPASPGAQRDAAVGGRVGGKPPHVWAGEFQPVKEHRVCIAHRPCISVPIPSAQRPGELEALMCTLGAGEGARAVRLGCQWEGPCFARGGKYLATMIPLLAFYYELPQCWGYEAAGDEAGS